MRTVALALVVMSTVAWAETTAKPKSKSDEAQLKELVEMQALGEDADKEAWLAPGGEMWSDPDDVGLGYMNLGTVTKHKVTDWNARIQPDGATALISFTLKFTQRVSSEDVQDFTYRFTEVAKKSDGGWKVHTGFYSEGEANAGVNKAAKAGALKAFPATGSGGDASLVEATQALMTKFDEAAVKRKDLVSFGSAPKERTVGGAKLAKSWAAGWAGKTKVDAVKTSKALGPTMGFAIANLTRQKGDYTIPFRVMFVFERPADGQPWSLVHAHFTVPRP